MLQHSCNTGAGGGHFTFKPMGLHYQAHLWWLTACLTGPRRADMENWNKSHTDGIYSRKSKSREEAGLRCGVFSAILKKFSRPLTFSEIHPRRGWGVGGGGGAQ